MTRKTGSEKKESELFLPPGQLSGEASQKGRTVCLKEDRGEEGKKRGPKGGGRQGTQKAAGKRRGGMNQFRETGCLGLQRKG